MEGCRKGVLAVLIILTGLAAPGSSFEIIEGPKNLTVLQGSEARFNCTVSPGWRLIMWALNNTVVLSLTPSEPIITSDRFTSSSYQVDGNFVSEMVIHNVQFNDSGRIRCSLQNSEVDATAFLSVQAMGDLYIPGGSLSAVEDEPCNVTCRATGWTQLPVISWEIGVPVSHSSYFSTLEPGDFPSAVSILTLTPQGNGMLTCVATMSSLQVSKSVTVNLTVVQPPLGSIDKPNTSLPTWAIVLLAVSLSLLLILIIVLIVIFCCCCVSGREKKESSYQSEIRKSAQVKTTNQETFETKLKSGNENRGYSSDEPRAAEAASVPPRSRELGVLEQQNRAHAYQDQDLHWPSHSASGPRVSVNVASPRKVRNVTMV
ncbi:immunoglobulin superfamily member 5 isoform X1 [Ochotona curzoniae]|uniref:immunoglobulin superfamily member 5 isoform X1 n=1 Tax=Ochotona curzoniae TaxID=130825 RepID=UPI001B3490E1|nr:immunoglobulin superfamily member 5 isoform X1 [Ochotona curzoniae]